MTISTTASNTIMSTTSAGEGSVGLSTTASAPDGRRAELPLDMLERFRARAGQLDQANDYFHEDLDELRAFGYLRAAVPDHLGGWGLDLAQVSASQRRLARYAPA